MSKTLDEVAGQLIDSQKKVQLIYAFNGTGKTRLSREFKQLIDPKPDYDEASTEQTDWSKKKVLYYSAFTEDLFYWDNDLTEDAAPKLRIQPNAFTDWILRDQGQDQNITTNFQRYTSQYLTPHFSEDFSEVTFTIERGDDESSGHLKVSKSEESNFIWSIFYTLIDQVIEILNEPSSDEEETTPFDELQYVFIDDPVTSLDENHLIELAVHLAQLIKSSKSGVKFIITTHNPLFYNVLFNELNSDDRDSGYRKKWFEKYRLAKQEDSTYQLLEHRNDSPFSW